MEARQASRVGSQTKVDNLDAVIAEGRDKQALIRGIDREVIDSAFHPWKLYRPY